MNTVSVVIPVYKNLDEFVHNLSVNIPFFDQAEIIIVNDDPESSFPSSLALSQSMSRHIKWINHSANEGFSRSVNDGVRQASGDYVLLLNSGVQLKDSSWINLIQEFEGDHNLFAVGFAQEEKDGVIVGRNELYFKNGLFHHRGLAAQLSNTEKTELLPTAWAECGAALFRKAMWDALGGLDEQYSPFYWEDVDISYRATQKGWSVRFAPQVVVKHNHESTTGTYFKDQISTVAYRNQLYFTQKCASGIQRISFACYKLKLTIRKIVLGK